MLVATVQGQIGALGLPGRADIGGIASSSNFYILNNLVLNLTYFTLNQKLVRIPYNSMLRLSAPTFPRLFS